LIAIDTSGIVAVVNGDDPDHSRTVGALLSDPGPYLIPVSILSEIAYLLEQEILPSAFDRFLLELETRVFTLHFALDDLPRIRHLIGRYSDLPLGFADAAVVACAERHGGRVLTLDRRHFGVVEGEGRISLLP
jgi:uncharacterized protein